MERFADGNIAIEGHGSKDEDLSASKDVHGKDLQHAVTGGDGFSFHGRSAINLGVKLEV